MSGVFPSIARTARWNAVGLERGSAGVRREYKVLTVRCPWLMPFRRIHSRASSARFLEGDTARRRARSPRPARVDNRASHRFSYRNLERLEDIRRGCHFVVDSGSIIRRRSRCPSASPTPKTPTHGVQNPMQVHRRNRRTLFLPVRDIDVYRPDRARERERRRRPRRYKKGLGRGWGRWTG